MADPPDPETRTAAPAGPRNGGEGMVSGKATETDYLTLARLEQIALFFDPFEHGVPADLLRAIELADAITPDDPYEEDDPLEEDDFKEADGPLHMLGGAAP